jgi:hypothetical protein
MTLFVCGLTIAWNECDRYVYFFPLSRLPEPLAKGFHGAVTQCWNARRLYHRDFAYRTCLQIERDPIQAKSPIRRALSVYP